MNQSLTNPFVSVLIRSYNRLPHVLEIVDICLTQNYDNFEVVVIDQSNAATWEKYESAFNRYDRRVRVIRSQPLGPIGARNSGVAHCHGEVVLFMDDDDLPVGEDWIASHAKHFVDPLCIGVSGKHVHAINERPRYRDMERAYDRCLTHSFLLRGRVFTGIARVKKPVEWLHGNNCSLRRERIVALGGWYPYLKTEGEEHSLYYKFQQTKMPGEYLMFDPQPIVLRRFDIPGGNDRRNISLHELLDNRMKYYHWVIAENFPLRFYGLYPIFMLHGFKMAARFYRRQSSFTDIFWIRWLGPKYGQYFYILQELVKFPFLALRYLLTKKPKWDGRITALGEEYLAI